VNRNPTISGYTDDQPADDARAASRWSSMSNWFLAWTGNLKAALSSTWWFGAYFFLLAMVIILTFLIYTQVFVVEAMNRDTRHTIKQYAFAFSMATRDTVVIRPGAELDVIFETIQRTDFPVVITDNGGYPHYWRNVGVAPDNRSIDALIQVAQIAKRLDNENLPFPFSMPTKKDLESGNIISEARILHFGHSELMRRLSWLPWVTICILALLVGVGYAGFRHIKNSEQRSLWVGMARETAHQLGTPLSSLYGWIELTRSELEASGDDSPALIRKVNQVLGEIEKDTSRLNKIASRFSLIGSVPELRVGELNQVIAETVSYVSDRLPKNVKVIVREGDVPPVPMNRELLSWTFENLLKNAADAMEGKGGRIEIATVARPTGDLVDVLVRDNGKGIPPHLVKRVFIPGYSTKKRGWGLGLAFVKRIIEDYHRGKVSVQESSPGFGTTFLLTLPVAAQEV